MKTVIQVMESLLVLQQILLKRARPTSAAKEDITRLRSGIPEGVMGHFDRLLARGKKGVAIARNGVCSECHLKISSGTLASLPHRNDIHLCDSCGRYLYLPPETMKSVPENSPAPAKAKKPRRKPEPALA
jgi:predicted  nucleic acid-binding Zn-ribbon protein